MANHQEHKARTKELIDSLKTICGNYGLGNTGYEYKIISEVFLYKFLNDKFFHEARKADKDLAKSTDIEADLTKLSDNEYEYLLEKIGTRAAKFKKHQFISYLFNRQNEDDFDTLFDNTLVEIAEQNINLYSVTTISRERIRLFDRISQYIIDRNQKSNFCRAIINKLAEISFEPVFDEKYDFFSTIFEYLIKDYNKDSGQYAEYYTPAAVANIMSKILAPDPVKSVTLYDPAAGSGSLLMALAHQIGEEKCSIYTQDVSQKSSEFLRLNLILNNLVHSLNNVIQGNTLKNPFHTNEEGTDLRKFDYIVCNPPFKMDFSDDRETLASDTHKKRFFAGVPKIPNKDKQGMEVYLLFIQHIVYSLKHNGKTAIVVPTGFIKETGIAKKIRKVIIDNNWLHSVIHMPPNIFARTGTNVSVVFIDKQKNHNISILVDASKLGTKVKDGKNQKTLLSKDDEDFIINTVNLQNELDNFSVVVNQNEIKENSYYFGAGQYFDVKIEYSELTHDEFNHKLNAQQEKLQSFFEESHKLEKVLFNKLKELDYDI